MTFNPTLQQLEEENRQLRTQLMSLRRREHLTHLLKGEYNTLESVLNDLKDYGVHFENIDYVIAFVTVQASLEKSTLPFSQVVDRAEQLMDEVYSSEFFALLVHVERGTACILGIEERFKQAPKSSTGLIQTLGRLSEELCRRAAAELGIGLLISTSRPVHGAEGLFSAYQDVLQINTFRELTGDSRAILHYYLFETGSDAGMQSVKAMQLEKRYITAVESSDFSKARELMQELINAEFSGTEFSLNMLKTNVMSKLGMLVKTTEMLRDSVGEPRLTEVYKIVYAFQTEGLRLEQLSEVVNEVFDKIEDLRNSRLAKKQLPWIPQVLSYLELNFRDVNLSVDSIAAAFGLNPTYMSRELKRATGHSAFEQLQMIRLSHAMALIKNGMTLERVACETGFSNTKALRRAVVKHEGLLPAQISRGRG